MTTLLDLSTVNKDELIKQETERKFYEALYNYFDDYPFLYDICKNILSNPPAQNYLIYEIGYTWMLVTINENSLTFTYAYRRLTPHEICFLSVDLRYNSGKFTFENLTTEIDFDKLPFDTTKFEKITPLQTYYDEEVLWTGRASVKQADNHFSITYPKEFCQNIHKAIC